VLFFRPPFVPLGSCRRFKWIPYLPGFVRASDGPERTAGPHQRPRVGHVLLLLQLAE